ncbi:MAG: site-2 protease family protein [Candidatus Dormibacteria bacterium]
MTNPPGWNSPPPMNNGTPGATPPPMTFGGYSPVPPGPAAPQRRKSGIGGAIGAALLAILKFGAIILKAALPLWAFLISFAIMVGIFGWGLGIGVIVLIAIHELGHYVASWMYGIPAKLPVFLGPFGAVTMRSRVGTPVQAAVIAIAGPVAGFLIAALALGASTANPNGSFTGILAATASIGFTITLLNLIPFSPLDGGRVAEVISRKFAIAGLVIFVAVIAGMYLVGSAPNPIVFIILIAGIFSLRSTGKQAAFHIADRSSQYLVIATYVLLIVACIVGTGLAYHQLSMLGYNVTAA